jgi:hypothetical protein
MSNKVLLKKSSVLGKIPAEADLDYGELALNYADGLLYFKNSSNQILSFSAGGVSLTATQTLTNKTLTSPTLNTPSINGGNISVGNGTLIIPFSAAPAQTETASLVYDSGVGTLTIGTGSGRKTFVELTASQTITNKTLTAPTLTNAVLTGTLTANSSTGTSGQYLRSTGTGVSWASFPAAYTLPASTTTTLGGVIVGSGLNVTDGTISTVFDGAYGSLTGTPTLSTVATSGSYADLTNKPTLFSGSYADLTNKPTIPSAIFSTVAVAGQTSISAGSSTATLNIAAGTGITLSTTPGTNTLTINGTSSLTAATTTTLGGVIIPAVGTSGITNNNGTIGLATASTTQLGGIKVDGTSITIADGVISATAVTPTASTLAGTTLASNVVNSSLTSVGTLTNLTVTNPITGSITGNAGTVTNGLYSTGSYTNPDWIASLAAAKITGLAASATSDTTNAANILTGTISSDRLPTATNTVLGAVKIDGTSITITNGVISAVAAVGAAAAGQLTGTTLAANVVNSSLTSVGTLTNLTVTNPITGSVTGSAGSVSAANIVGTIPTTSLPKATTGALGAVRVDGTSITIDSNGIISSTGGSGSAGSGTINAGSTGNLGFYASSTTAISPLTSLNWNSGTNTLSLTGTLSATTISGSLAASNLTGTIASARLPIATTSAVGGVRVDGTTITVDPSTGVISSSGGGGGTSDAGSLTGSTLAANVVNSSLNTVGTLTGLNVSGDTIISSNTQSTSKTTGALTVTGGVGVSGNIYASNVYSNGVLLSAGGSYTLPKASTSVLGGVKVDGTTITIGADGTITSTASGGGGGGSTANGVVPFDCGFLSEIAYRVYDFGSIV